MMALEWRDIDLRKRQICVQRSEWKGHVTVPKGGRLRYVPMTVRLATALRQHRHLRAARVLCRRDGSSLSADVVKHHVERAARRAQLTTSGVHRLRHDVLLASRDARRAGAGDSGTRRASGSDDDAAVHAPSPAAIEGAIRLLDDPKTARGRGDMVETGNTASDNSNR
jgi:integrase